MNSHATKRVGDGMQHGIFALMALVVTWGAFVSAARARDMTFFVTGDLHYSTSTASNNAANITAMNTIGSSVSPRGVVVVGDLINGDVLYTSSQWNLYEAAYPYGGGSGSSQIHYPVYDMSGNHDRWLFSSSTPVSSSSTIITDKLKSRHSSAGFGSTLTYSWNWDGVHMVCMDLYPSSDNITWLSSDLSSVASTTPVVIFSHYGYESYSQNWWSNWSTESAAFQNVIGQHNVVALVHGHIHDSCHYSSWQGYDAFTSGSPKETYNGFGSFNFADKSYTWKEYKWNSAGTPSLDWTFQKTFSQRFFSAANSSVWNASTMNWGHSSGYYNSIWIAGCDAVFEGSGGAVTVGAAVAADSMTFNVGGYVLSGGGITLTGAGGSITTNSGTITIASPIAGSVGLTKYSGGALILTGANTYSGTTMVCSGSLQIGAGGASGALGAGNVVNYATLIFNRSDAYAVGGAISGPGSLTQAGGGTTTLTGANSYTGTTIISGGALQIGAGGAAGALGTSYVTDNATLIFNRSDAYTVSNVISGSGALVQAGGGTTTLTGANTYSGATTISAGALQVGAGSTTGTIGSGNVINNAALIFNHSNTYVVSNAISGSGTLTQAGSGTLRLSGANSYTGPTVISGGTLQIGNGGTGGAIGSGNVVNNATLTFNRSNAYAVGADISGDGNLIQAGSGALTLAGANTYSGDTTITRGTLSIAAGGSLLLDVNDPGLAFSQILGGGVLNLNGALRLDLDDVNAAAGAWNLIDAESLAAVAYGAGFSVLTNDGGSFTAAGDVWTRQDGARTWTFAESTGTLSLTSVPEPGAAAALAACLLSFIAWRLSPAFARPGRQFRRATAPPSDCR